MMNVDLQQLIQTLTAATRRDLERSAERCISRGGREVLVEDLLLALLEHHDGLLLRALADAGVEPGELQDTLQPKGETSASHSPVFAPALVLWLQQALMVAHLELRQTEVGHGALLLALLRHPLQHAGSGYQRLLSRLDTQALRLLDELHLQLAALNRESAPEQAAFKMVKLRMEGQQPLLGHVRDAAVRLPLPLGGWFEGIADDSWRLLLNEAYGYVNQRYQSEVHGFYVKAIQRRYPFNAHASSDVALDDFQEFFKGRGVMGRFYEGYLRPFVSAEGGRYRLRGLDGRSLPLSRSLLDQLGKAQMIRQGFFSEDQGEWAVRFTLAPYSLDQAVNRAVLRIGDQQLEYRHGPIVPMTFHWPSEAGNGRSSLVLERGAARPMGIEKNSGAWSWFRLLELMQSEPASGSEAQIIKADLAGLRANYLLASQRNPSPFQMAAWRTFRLPDQL